MSYTDKPWDGSKSRWSTVEDLLKCIPAGMRKRAHRLASKAGREVTKSDCSLPYKEPGGSVINIHGVASALGRLNQVQGATSEEISSSRAELERARRAGRRALGLPPAPDDKMSRLLSLAAAIIAEEEQRNSDTESQKKNDPVIETSLALASYMSDGSAAGAKLAPCPSDLSSPEVGETHPAWAYGIFEDNPKDPDNDGDDDTNEEGDKDKDYATSGNAETKLAVMANDYRPLPDFKKLGIDRPAGPAIPEEMEAFKGQTKSDGSPVTTEDFFSVGALLANNDLIEDRMRVIPAVELERLATILRTRSKQSDTDHSRKVMTGYFTVVNPKIGVDEGTQLNMYNPLRNREPYTALVARAMFPLADQDEGQKAAVEAARRGRLKNLSIAPYFDSLVCGSCGEATVYDTMCHDGMTTSLVVNPEMSYLLSLLDKNVDMLVRIPNPNVVGGFIYKDVSVMSSDGSSGVLNIQPVKLGDYLVPVPGTIIMTRMMSMPIMFTGMGGGPMPKYCTLHGLEGSDMGHDSKVVGVFANATGLINVSLTDSGAINDARLVLDPSCRY